jgi:hypothetical protein
MVFQAITTPDGLVSSLFGPFISRSNNWGMYKDSRVAHRVHRMMPAGSNRQMLYLYGDSAYHLSHGVISLSGPRKQISQRKRRFNKDVLEYKPLNAARECGVTFFSNRMSRRIGSPWNTTSARFSGSGRRYALSRVWRLAIKR